MKHKQGKKGHYTVWPTHHSTLCEIKIHMWM